MVWGCGCVCWVVLGKYLLYLWFGGLEDGFLRGNVMLSGVICWVLWVVLEVGEFGGSRES